VWGKGLALRRIVDGWSEMTIDSADPGEGITAAELRSIYQRYLDCLNAQDWPRLGEFVHDSVSHNGRPLGVAGYRSMLENAFRQIPDLHFRVELLVCEPPAIAARLRFHCSPRGEFLGLPLNGRTVSFAENIFYAFEGRKIRTAWSVLDKSEIEAQLP
jgi:predicted ester cyclase